MHPKEEIERLKKLVNYHNNLYYNLDNPILSDTQYDELYKQLKDLEDRYPQYRTKIRLPSGWAAKRRRCLHPLNTRRR